MTIDSFTGLCNACKSIMKGNHGCKRKGFIVDECKTSCAEDRASSSVACGVRASSSACGVRVSSSVACRVRASSCVACE
jgi:hypothetical protein